MSSGKSELLIWNNKAEKSPNPPEKEFDISPAVIPFSKLFKKSKSNDIYSGTENIPFSKRSPEFQMILRQEFAHALKDSNDF